jgi:predicted amidophosphoribosyltransferase
MDSYDLSNLTWEDENKLSLLPYYSNFSGKSNHANTILLRNFKEDSPTAVQCIREYALQALDTAEIDFRDMADQWYIVSAPRSTARQPNTPCEKVCTYLTSNLSWIHRLPGALVRIRTVPSSSKAAIENRPRTSQQDHENTIIYVGPTLQALYGIILVDDILTTSNTFNACYGILRKATQCEHIVGFFMGRTQRSTFR